MKAGEQLRIYLLMIFGDSFKFHLPKGLCSFEEFPNITCSVYS